MLTKIAPSVTKIAPSKDMLAAFRFLDWGTRAFPLVLIAFSAVVLVAAQGAALAVAALALAIRELVLPFVLLMGALAAWRHDWRETAAWGALVAAFIAVLSLHHAVVADFQRASDIAGPSWLALRGLEGWIGNIVDSSPLYLLPYPAAVIIAGLALLGWCTRRTPSGLAASLLLLGYGLAFMIAGRENNFYGGLIVTPILFVGLAFVPQALRTLPFGAARGIRHA